MESKTGRSEHVIIITIEILLGNPSTRVLEYNNQNNEQLYSCVKTCVDLTGEVVTCPTKPPRLCTTEEGVEVECTRECTDSLGNDVKCPRRGRFSTCTDDLGNEVADCNISWVDAGGNVVPAPTRRGRRGGRGFFERVFGRRGGNLRG